MCGLILAPAAFKESVRVCVTCKDELLAKDNTQ
jgi:hypothetical protein